jgi:flagellin
MSSVINTNSLSLLTQNNLTKSQGALNTSIERLSSGMRINSPKDDAAGQAIANRFTANIKGLKQAQRNANDGISMAQTTEGALGEINTNLQRIRELTVQSANGSNTTADKASIQAEITQRLAEIDRTSAQTDFNGVKVLASNQSLSFQIGANDGQTVAVDLKTMDRSALGLTGFNVSGSTQKTNFTTVAGGVTTTTAVNLTGVTSAVAGAGAGLTLQGYGTYTAATDTYANYSVTDSTGSTYKLTGGDVNALTGAVANTTIFATAASMATAKAAYDADSAVVNGGATGSALAVIDLALKKVDDQRGSLGAVQNRFDSVISNLGTTVTNLASSRSRIEDADYAVEVSNMTRAQILLQAGTSVLAKANQSTQGVLSLLQ